MASLPRRPALGLVPVNANIATVQQKETSINLKRSREDDPEDAAATRSSGKRPKLEATPSSAVPVPSLHITSCTPDSRVSTQDRSKNSGTTTKGLEVVKDAGTSKKSRADKEKSRAARLEAEEDFRHKYRTAFPHWKFYFDGIPPGIINTVTRDIEQLGAVVESFLSKNVTHLITPVRLDKDKENDTVPKPSLVIPSLGGLRSPLDLKTGYNPVDCARKWKCKIWDIEKLESVLERTLARPAKPEATPQSSLKGLLSQEKASTAAATTTIAKPTASVPLFKTVKTQNPFNIANVTYRGGPIGLQHRKLPPVFHPSNTTAAAATNMRDRKLNPASRALNGLLKTEKATNTTMERDPRCQRHDYTYFAKLSAFVIVQAVNNDHQVVGRLEYKPKNAASTFASSLSSSLTLSITSRNVDTRAAFHTAHRGATGRELPEYPLLHLDHRMRSPFQPYNPRAEHKEFLLETKEADDRRDREAYVRMFRAHKRVIRENGRGLASMSMGDLKAAASAHRAHGYAHDIIAEPDRASGFIHSTTGTGAYGSIASGSVASLSTAFTGSGYPPETSRLATSLSLSQSGGGDGWAKFFGVAGVVPSFGGVRNATQVVMNRGAFAESASGTLGAPVGGGARSRTTSLTRTASFATAEFVRAAQKAAVAPAGGGTGAGHGALRRTQSLAAIKSAKEVEVEKKKAEGYCECCKEQYESLVDHIKGKKHRKFASDPRRYKELDLAIQKLARVTKRTRQMADAMRAPVRVKARERYIQRMMNNIAGLGADGAEQSDGQQLEEEQTIVATSEGDPHKTFSSSLGLAPGGEIDFIRFFDDCASSEPSCTVGTTTTATDTSACITPIDELGPPVERNGKTSDAQKKEVIVISSDPSAGESSFELPLAGSSSYHPSGMAHASPAALSNSAPKRFAYRGTPMPSRRIFDAEIINLSTDPASAESEALGEVLRRRKKQAVAQLALTAQTSEREADSDELEIVAT